MVEAAFGLFDEQGYDATTVEQIVERAGVSRSTFFRVFGSKEDVIFPRHDDLQARIDARLGTGTRDTYLLAVSEAARLVLEQYLDEGPLASSRYRLTRSVPALRDREIASMLGYQRLFREHVRRWLDGDDADLHAELLAAAVVTAHNVVLRRWLRGQTDDPRREFSAAMARVFAMAAAWSDAAAPAGTTVVVLRSGRSLDEVLPALRAALD
ncbi:MAG: TetR family transcriptional regulator [Cellulomonas sp.]|nr:TetR family transcriptional regulator [Cellulomonas sp.]